MGAGQAVKESSQSGFLECIEKNLMQGTGWGLGVVEALHSTLTPLVSEMRALLCEGICPLCAKHEGQIMVPAVKRLEGVLCDCQAEMVHMVKFYMRV